MPNIVIAIASDHAGIDLKSAIIHQLTDIKFLDIGTNDSSSVDYPDYAYQLSQKIINKQANYGILICGSGIGMSIAANRFPEIRAALCHTNEQAMLAKQHNDANVLVLGARIINQEQAISIITTFLNTAFAGGRHEIRKQKLSNPPLIN
jgi:ribose 5-phosphate isomerase B